MDIANGSGNKFAARLSHLFRILLVILPLAFAGNIIYTILSSEFDMLHNLLEFRIGYLFLAIFLALAPWPAQSARIIVWSRVFKKPVTASQAFRAVLSSDIAAAATPTLLGGGYAKAGYLISYGLSAGEATIITILGTIEDTFFFLIALPASILICRAWDNPYVKQAWANLISHWPVVLIVAAMLPILFVIVKKFGKSKNQNADMERAESLPLREKSLLALRGFKTDLKTGAKFILTRGKTSFVAAVIITGIGWCARYGAISALVAGLGLVADPVLFFLLQWVVFTTMTMIPTPGAIGGAEVSFALVYNGLIPSFAIPVVTSGWRFMTFYLPVSLGSLLFSLLGGATLKKKREGTYIIKENIKPAVYDDSAGQQKALR